MKQELRKHLLQKRDSLTPEMRKQKSHKIFELLKPYLHHARCVGIYKSFSSEVETDEIIAYLLLHEKTVGVPRCVEKGKMHFYAVDEHTVYKQNCLGIKEPQDGDLLSPSDIDLMIIPMTGFDGKRRLGYGGGFYDRYLLECDAYKIGLAYAIQETSFSEEPHDIEMDIVLHDAMK